jgi:MFS family permease
MGFSEKERDIYLGSYIGLSTMLGQMIGSLVSGLLTDSYSRKTILIVALITGSISTAMFGWPLLSYPWLLVLRVLTGVSQSTVIPVLFSLIGDYYKVENRATASAIVSSFLGGGMMLGQLFVGFCISYIGWRLPFLLIGLSTLASAAVVNFCIVDPPKGGNEEDLASLVRNGISLPTMSVATLYHNLLVPTVFIMLVQTIPNTIPWGILSAHLHDLLATDANLSMQEATYLMGIFGTGAAFGGFCGGFIGAKMYSYNRKILPSFMGLTLAASSYLLKQLLSMDLAEQGVMQLAYPVLVCSGALGAVNGANIRIVVLNLTSPEGRGASIAVLNFVNCVGRGFGPLIVDLWMTAYRIERKPAISTILNLWVVSGLLMCSASFTIVQDEDRLKLSLRKYAMEKDPHNKLTAVGV